MADLPSDSPVPTATTGPRRKQRPPSSTQPQQRRNNNRNRKSDHFEGAVSDSAVFNPVESPRSNKAQHKHRSNVGIGGVSDQNVTSRYPEQKQRQPSMNAGQVLLTPAKEQAYAGPTFQASPAASSLPLPKFFSKSLPNGGYQPSLQGRLAGEKSPADGGSSPEPDAIVPPARESQQSPLDLFFEADRAEKEKSRSGSGSLSPESARRPAPSVAAHRNPHRHSGKGIFLSELDGDDENKSTSGPVPLVRRPALDRASSSPGIHTRQNESEDERQAKTKSLKELLWNAASTPPSSHSRHHSGSQTPDGFFGSPSPFSHSPSGPSTPQPPIDDQHQSNYSLHYGNRNLSPLFKAARSETPPRPSTLRQELADDNNSSNYPLRPQHSASADTTSYARSYLQKEIGASGTVEVPQLPFSDKSRPLNGSSNLSCPVTMPVQPVDAQHGAPDSAMSARARGPDVRSMEDDLRRMLKIG